MNSFLKSNKPAHIWEACYPMGNGIIGITEEGKASGTNHIYLNDATFWSGDGKDKHRYVIGSFKKLRELVKADKLTEAESLIASDFLGENGDTYLPIGTLVIDTGFGIVSKYCRKLDMNKALQTITYTKNGSPIEETSFVSYPDSVYVKRITSKKPQSATINFESEIKSWNFYSLENNIFRMDGYAPIKKPDSNEVIYIYDESLNTIRFSASFKVETDGVVTGSALEGLRIKNYTSLTLYYSSATSLVNGSTEVDRIPASNVMSAEVKGFDLLLARHEEDYTALFNQSSLELNGVTDSPEDTYAAVLEADKTGKPSAALWVTLFDFGRYLTIAGSRKGTPATNLQGIWNIKTNPAWSSNYTININTEMNYWCQDALGLGECTMPLFDLVDKIAENGKKVATDTFGMSGFVCGHNADIWGNAGMVGRYNPSRPWTYGYNISCSGWLAYHYYDHFLYTKDMLFLKERALPIITEALKFYFDYMEFDEDSMLMACPGTSPENSFKYDGKTHAVSRNATIDTAVIRSLMNAYIHIAGILNLKNDPLLLKCNTLMKYMRPYILNQNGAIAEWYYPYEEKEPTHRHLSHLIGVYPMSELTPENAPELTDAVRKTLEVRGDEGSGWSIAWRSLIHARLKDGDKALAELSLLIRKVKGKHGKRGGSYPSLFGAHPPFQIDSNYGATAAITEMLVQSYTKETKLLPALPSSWTSGKVRGFRTRNGEVLNFDWHTEDGKVVITEAE